MSDEPITLQALDRGQGDWFSGHYRDGCDLSASCFDCPLPACRFEMPRGRARALTQAVQLMELLAQGRTMDQAAVDLGVSRRTVYRLRRMNRQPTGRPAPLSIIEPTEVFVDGRPACVRCRWAPRMIAATIAFEMTPRGLVCRREDECRTRQRGAA